MVCLEKNDLIIFNNINSGIASFRDRYLLTIDSKATDNQTAEKSRLLLFDPNNGQLVYEQRIVINQEDCFSL